MEISSKVRRAPPAMAALALLALCSAASAQGGQAVVVNGDTLLVGAKRIYLRGVDAPEMDQYCLVGRTRWACGKQAARELAAKIGGQPVTCKTRVGDEADCWGGGVNLGAWMVSSGWAAATRRDSIYAGQESRARRARRGIWQSEFVRPWAWRRGLRSDTAATNSEARDCPIKGDVSASGERIYYLPKTREYSRVQIDAGNNERWFCSVKQAVRAGWRAPRR